MRKPEPEVVAVMLQAHAAFVERMPSVLVRLERCEPEAMQREIRAVVEGVCDEACATAGLEADAAVREWIAGSVLDEAFGFGPLEPLLVETDCEAIVIRGPREVWVEDGRGRHEHTTVFADDEHVERTLERHPLLTACVRRTAEETDGGSALRIDVRELKRRFAEQAAAQAARATAAGISRPGQPLQPARTGWGSGLWAWFAGLFGVRTSVPPPMPPR